MSAYSPKPANTSICRAKSFFSSSLSEAQSLIVLGLRREHGVGRHDAERLLPRERLLANLVPALIELALVFLDPFLRHMMRRMCRARREIDEERLVGSERFLRLHPRDRMVRHVGHEVVARTERRVDAGHVLIDRRVPLVRLAAEEAVEMVEARAGRPAVGRPRDAELPGRRLVASCQRRRSRSR